MKSTRPTTRTRQVMEELTLQIDSLRDTSKVNAEKIKDNQTELVEKMEKLGIMEFSFISDGKTFTVKKQHNDAPLFLDEKKFQRKIGAELWGKVTRRVVDKNLLDALIAAGDIKEQQVALCSSEGDRPQPFVKVTKRLATAKDESSD